MKYQKVEIKDFEDYQVDTNGIIYGKNGNPLKPSRNKHGQGYCIVQLRKNGKTYGQAVHIIVAKTFIDNPENKKQVNHINGNKADNRVENLEWNTQSENMQHAFHVLGKKAPNEKPIIGYDKNNHKIMYEFSSLMDAGRYFASVDGVNARGSQYSIWRVLSGKRHTYKNCVWQYKINIDNNYNS